MGKLYLYGENLNESHLSVIKHVNEQKAFESEIQNIKAPQKLWGAFRHFLGKGSIKADVRIQFRN